MFSLKRFFNRWHVLKDRPNQDTALSLDMIDHPDLCRMDLRQLADLPLAPQRSANVVRPVQQAKRSALAP